MIKRWKGIGSGFTVIYLANLSLIHFFGALIYVLPWYGFRDIDTTLKGFRVASYGMVAFSIGNLILAPYLFRLINIRVSNNLKSGNTEPLQNLPKIYVLIGIISYFILFSIIGQRPTFRAIVSVGQQLMVVGICLGCWKAWVEKNKRELLVYLILSISFPFITIIIQGFIGYGTVMTLAILLFIARLVQPKWKVLITGFLLVYLALTFYQSYMRDRKELRTVIWGKAPVIERIEELSTTLWNTEWFNPFNKEHLIRIDNRLNQNFLVGKSIDYLEKWEMDYAYGKTLWESMIALIPRIIWPEKPVYAGSPGIVSKYTGMRFTRDTSVGVGQVMEFYINFGTICVIIGFLILGIIIAIIDTMSGYHLLKGSSPKFALWILPGLGFLQVGGSLVEVTASAGAGLVVACLISRLRSSNYPLLLAIIYFLLISYLGIKYIIPLNYPYLEILVLIVIVLVAIKYLLPVFRGRIKG